MSRFPRILKRRWKFIEGKESLFVYIGLALAYVLLIVLVVFVYKNIEDKIRLEMKFDSEKSFNSVYMAMTESSRKALTIMEEEGVSAVGIYSSNGEVYQSLGDAPSQLPLAKLSVSRRQGDDSTLGIYIYDKDSENIEYFRLSRFNVMLDTGIVRFDSSGLSQSTGVIQAVGQPSVGVYRPAAADIPEIVYIKFSGENYFASIRRSKIFMVVGFALITGLMLLVLNIYQSNRRYRMALEKNERLANLGAAARTLTHEIKNPLSAMTIQSALLRKMLPEGFQADLDVMDHEILRLTNLTNRVSEFLKNPTGDPEEIELVSFLKDLARLFRNRVSLEFNGADRIYVFFDADRARSVFENLMKNAAESCEGRDPEVEVEVRVSRRRVSVCVRDRGDGLPKEMRDKLFDPFFTTKIHGSGIGLSISRQFVEAQGGTLKLYDRDGGGTVAEVVLPCDEWYSV